MYRKDNFNFFEKILWKLSRDFLSDRYYSYLSLKRWDSNSPNLQKPQSFNEKIRYLSLFDRRPIYTFMADKLKSKKIVQSIIDESIITPTLRKWTTAESISFEGLPQKFVLKTNHSSGDIFFVENNDIQTLKKAILHFKKALKKNHYKSGREWAYKDINRCVFAEEIFALEKDEIIDYKFFCFNGNPKFIQVDTSRFKNHKRDFYDLNWNFLGWEFGYPNSVKKIKKPKGLIKMIEISKKLSKSFPFCRIDLFNIQKDGDVKIRFGEVTFYPEGGSATFKPEELNLRIGGMISLDDIKNL